MRTRLALVIPVFLATAPLSSARTVEQERKIRTDPAAQVTSLLKQVFGK